MITLQHIHLQHQATDDRITVVNYNSNDKGVLIMCHRRKTQAAMRPALDSSALSSDDDDSLYDPSTITSILTEGNLHTSSC